MVWIRRIDPQALLEATPQCAMIGSERERGGLGFRRRETRRGEQDANGTKSKARRTRE